MRSVTEAPPDVLFLTRGAKGATNYPGIVDGLSRMTADQTLRGAATLAIDPSQAAQTSDTYWADVIDHVGRRKTDIVVLHHFHSPSLYNPRSHMDRLRSLPHRPLVVLTNGDAFFDNLFRPSFPAMFLQAAMSADLVLSTSMGDLADHLAKRAGCPVALWPPGACQARFGTEAQAMADDPEFQVVFIGSNNRPRNPLRMYHWYSRRRERLIRKLSKRFGERFGLFGNGWDGIKGWRGPVPYARQQETCRRAEVIVGGMPFSSARYYLSDRTFNQIASGTPFVDLRVEGVDTILRDGDHWHLADSVDDIVDRCDDLLGQPLPERREFGLTAARHVLADHTEEARCRSLLRTLQPFRRALLDGEDPPAPDLSFFLPEIDVVSERERATRRWPNSAVQP